MILDIAKALSFFASILSLYPVVMGAFFVPGARMEDRLILALARVGLAGCISLLSGILFARPWLADPRGEHLIATLPVRIYLWTVTGVAVLFILSWYFNQPNVPWLWRDLP